MGITREQVFEAAGALRDAGREPTYLTVRERLGGGSFSTLARHLREWREEHGGHAATTTDGASGAGGTAAGADDARVREPKTAAEAAARLDALPAAFGAALLAAGERLWRTAEQHFTAEAARERGALLRAHQQTLAAKQREVRDAAAAADELQNALDQTVRAKNTALGERDALRRERDELVAARDDLTRRLIGSEAALAEAHEATRRAEGQARGAADEVRAAGERLAEERGRACAAEAGREFTVARLRERESELAAVAAERDRLRGEWSRAQSVNAALEGALAEARRHTPESMTLPAAAAP